MALERGKLVVRDKKGGKLIQVQFGDRPPMNVAQGEVSQSLLNRLNEFNGQEVECERIGGQPKQLREPGGSFVRGTAAPVAPTPARRLPDGNSRRPDRPNPSPPERIVSKTPGDFHNPYNFIPAPPRNIGHPELGDHPQVAQDSFDVTRYTGIIRVRLVAKTPLLVPDTNNQTERNGHKTFPLRMDATGRPLIPASSVRGMLRSAYEAVTNSRFGRFSHSQHKDRLAFRMEACDGLKLIPARVENGQIQLLTGTSNVTRDGKLDGPMYAAWLPRYHKGKPSNQAITYLDRTLPSHGDQVECWLELVQHHGWNRGKWCHLPNFQYWRVRQVVQAGSDIGTAPPVTPQTKGQEGSSWHEALGQPLRQVQGWVCITNANINRKHDERVFFVPPKNAPRSPGPFPVTEAHRTIWRELIANYQTIHEDALAKRKQGGQSPEQYLGGEPGQTAWSRHVYTSTDRELLDGTLCYVRLNDDQTEVEALFPVIIARELYDVSPWQLLDPSLRPASSIEELSPADRVFGWVHADADRGTLSRGDQAAARGLLQVGAVNCQSSVTDSVESFAGPGVPLAILSSPKPQQGRFYVARSPNGEAQSSGLPKVKTGYGRGHGLRGRKVFPHQRSLPDQHWANPTEDRTQATGPTAHCQEYRRPREKGTEKRDDQNRSILGWVKSGAEFTFDLHLHNLSKVELGALLWLLQLPSDHYFRLGGGKPLGFGSVCLSIDSYDVRSGEDLEARYSSWGDDSSGNGPSNEAAALFESAVAEAYLPRGAFDDVPFIKAFKTACTGHSDDLPVHYPRTSGAPTPEGESFRWFVSNEKEGVRHALGDLACDPGLPMLEDRSSKPRA